MKSLIVASLLAVGLAAAETANASENLAQKAGCTKCHAVADKKMGPAFKDVAAKNKSKAGAGGMCPGNPAVVPRSLGAQVSTELATNSGLHRFCSSDTTQVSCACSSCRANASPKRSTAPQSVYS